MFTQFFQVLYNLISELVAGTILLIYNILYDLEGIELHAIPINFSLFSETPIFSIDLAALLMIFFTIFYSMFFIVLLYKVTKKIIKKVFGVIRL